MVYPDASGSLQQIECVILDVSERGARLQTRTQIPHLAQVILEVNRGRTKVHGSVRYSVRGRMDWNIGVQFSTVTPVARIVPSLASPVEKASEEKAT